MKSLSSLKRDLQQAELHPTNEAHYLVVHLAEDVTLTWSWDQFEGPSGQFHWRVDDKTGRVKNHWRTTGLSAILTLVRKLVDDSLTDRDC